MSKKSYVAEQAAALRAVAAATKCQADLLSKHKWSDLDWGWLERRIRIEDVDRLYAIAMREDKQFEEGLNKGRLTTPFPPVKLKKKRPSTSRHF